MNKLDMTMRYFPLMVSTLCTGGFAYLCAVEDGWASIILTFCLIGSIGCIGLCLLKLQDMKAKKAKNG